MKPDIRVVYFGHDIGPVLRMVTRVNMNAPEPPQLVRTSQPAILRGLQRQAGVDTRELHALLRSTLQDVEDRPNEVAAKFGHT